MAEVTVRRVARWLRREFPVAPGAGRIRRVTFTNMDFAYTTPTGAIYLNKDYALGLQVEALLHEWCHVRIGWKEEPHTQEFWKELGRVSKAYEAWIEEQGDDE